MVAKIGVDTAENEPLKACSCIHALPNPGHNFRSVGSLLIAFLLRDGQHGAGLFVLLVRFRAGLGVDVGFGVRLEIGVVRVLL